MDWDKLETFYYVAKAGKIALASKQLKIAQPSLSRTIRILEEQLGVKLFFRSVQGLILTAQGELLFRIVARMFAEIETAKMLIQEDPLEPKGLLKITTTSEYITFWLSRFTSKFLKSYPKMLLTIARSPNSISFDARLSDIAICPFIDSQPTLIQNSLFSLSLGLYADIAYLQAAGVPQNLEDLNKHRLLILGDESGRPCNLVAQMLHILEVERKAPQTYIPVPSLSSLLTMTKNGGGVVLLSDDFAAEQPNLIRILPQLSSPRIDLYFIYPESLANSTRVAALSEYLQKMARSE